MKLPVPYIDSVNQKRAEASSKRAQDETFGAILRELKAIRSLLEKRDEKDSSPKGDE